MRRQVVTHPCFTLGFPQVDRIVTFRCWLDCLMPQPVNFSPGVSEAFPFFLVEKLLDPPVQDFLWSLPCRVARCFALPPSKRKCPPLTKTTRFVSSPWQFRILLAWGFLVGRSLFFLPRFPWLLRGLFSSCPGGKVPPRPLHPPHGFVEGSLSFLLLILCLFCLVSGAQLPPLPLVLHSPFAPPPPEHP